MAIKRSKPDPDGIICANIYGAASRHVPWRNPQGEAREAALAELREIVTHGRTFRADLLSQEAGLLRGISIAREGMQEIRDQRGWMADLIAEAAGDHLDHAIFDEWVEIGKERANPPGPGLGRLYSS